MHTVFIICNTVVPLAVLIAVSVVVITPYLVAFVAGLINGRMLKIRNISRHIGCVGAERYRSKVSWISLLFDMTGYTVFASFVVAITVVVPINILATDAIGLVLFACAALYFFDSFAFIFYEMRIVGSCIYIYSHWTMFSVVKIPIRDVTWCNAFHIRMRSWVEFTAYGRIYAFKTLRNGEEFVRAVNNTSEV